MTVVVADSSPLNYLVLIGSIDVLRDLFNEILVPGEVIDELRAPAAPPNVRTWAEALPNELRFCLLKSIPLDDILKMAGKAFR